MHKKISHIFTKWEIPTRQVAISELILLVEDEKQQAVRDFAQTLADAQDWRVLIERELVRGMYDK